MLHTATIQPATLKSRAFALHLTLRIGHRAIAVVDFVEASRVYEELRDASGAGRRTFPQGSIWQGGHEVGRVSYNGRVWAPKDWEPGDVPLFDPRMQGGL